MQYILECHIREGHYKAVLSVPYHNVYSNTVQLRIEALTSLSLQFVAATVWWGIQVELLKLCMADWTTGLLATVKLSHARNKSTLLVQANEA